MTNPESGAADPFDDLLEVASTDAVREVEGLLAVPDGPDTAAADARAIQLLENRSAGEQVVDRLDLDALLALGERLVARQRPGPPAPDDELRWAAWSYLDVVRRPALLGRIAGAEAVPRWADLIRRLVDASNLTFGPLFEQRVAGYGSRPLFGLPRGGGTVSWIQAAGRVGLIARSLLALDGGGADRRVAILSDNRLEMALTDLACLTSGIVDVMIPATATEAEVGYILEHCGATFVVASDEVQLRKIVANRERLARLEHVVVLDPAAASRDVLAFDQLLERAAEVSSETVGERRSSVAVDDLATIMYTSGTTGRPKGIRFSQRNIVFKRFARALALPAIGDGDRFLAYLPLYHTFGRFLEMCGCVFWGATYHFAESPSIDSLVREMGEVRPTVFISIPMKWMQLAERIGQEVDVEAASDPEITATVELLTGGELRWGLSAAGYLAPELFRFFQRHGVELMSGFGMTEATGGITMTVPGAYVDDSLGRPLPGIEAELAADGELVIRGPYVMMGYLDDPDGAPSFDPQGWFHTGDLMERDRFGELHMVDRKKEIYKNIQGQTIAPQKVENLFRDFESVGRIFLVGDHRPYNTALIYPNFAFREVDLGALDAAERKAHFRSLVVSANAFLAPFERIVDFAVIDRDFSADRGELTPKGTYRRKAIERSFSETIALLYRRTTLSVGGTKILIPNWLFQALGITTQEIAVEGDRLSLGSVGRPLTIRRGEDDEVRIGGAVYTLATSAAVDLGQLLSTPLLWLGNAELVEFAPLSAEHRNRRRRRDADLERLGSATVVEAGEDQRRAAAEAATRVEPGLDDLHLAAHLLNAADDETGELAVEILDNAIECGGGELTDTALSLLRRSATDSRPAVARRAFRVLAIAERPTTFRRTLAAFLDAVPDLLDRPTAAALNEHELSPDTVRALVDETGRRFRTGEGDPAAGVARALLDFLADYGAAHPTRFRQLRGFLTRHAVTASSADAGAAARAAAARLEEGFRSWLGRPARIAVDPETGLEYRWDDVVEFAEDVDEEARHRLLAAIKSTTMVQEGIFLFSRGATVRLDDILPDGVWVRHLGTDHGKSVYRMAVKTRAQGQFDLAVNLNRELDDHQVREEIDWLVVCAEERDRGPLVEDFGGSWPEHGLWTEEFIPGETLDRAIARLSRRELDRERLEALWPFAAWSAMSAYVDFWDRTGRRLVVERPTPGNVIVPTHDYHTGARLVSIAARKPFTSLLDLVESFETDLLAPVAQLNPRLEGVVGREVIFSSVLEIVGEADGVALLGGLLAEARAAGRGWTGELERYLEVVERRGFLPRRLYFAAKRFRKWDRLAPEATHTVRARTLLELYETYRLDELREVYPESRARFFRETVLRQAPEALAEGLERIIAGLRSGAIDPDDLSAAVADLRARLDLEPELDFFLARLSYPHLRPEDDAEYVASLASGVRQSEMVVTCLDSEGRPYRIRHALSPKEIARLHRLFLAAKLPVQFRPEHRFLVAVSDRGHLLGGLFYEVDEASATAHMDKIVVSEGARGLGVAGSLLDELANRLRAESFRWLTTGFFRPQFFYRHGFSVERRYAGLVRPLQTAAEE
ncbi:MAG: AMP-binding protein [Thermoanaerobaculales bacterium]|jgi:long-subunit acyl-CoA synthetase (AMP-forming)/GNAT superfamily N-acetyltransferase|nr:AMP-binding protein [Thermoanaerobaculales bacterium]